MAITHSQRGFALLIAVIFMSVMLTLGLQLASVGYKQTVLSRSLINSQYAFYAADSALECALYADQHDNLFAYPATDPSSPPSPSMTCGGVNAISSNEVAWNSSRWIIKSRLNLDGGSHCADVLVSKPNPASGGITYIFAQGYDVSCTKVALTGSIFSSRGISARY